MKTQTETTKLFESLNAEERHGKVSIAYNRDEVFMSFGPIGYQSIHLTAKQIAQLSQAKQEMFAKAQTESAEKDCVLLAGEETKVITNGSLFWCKQQIGMLPYKKLPRDPYTGKGCWVISRKGETLAEGYFDKDFAW